MADQSFGQRIQLFVDGPTAIPGALRQNIVNCVNETYPQALCNAEESEFYRHAPSE